MSSHWQIIESGYLSPEAIMAKDAALLAQLDPEGPSLLHFYDWNAPCLTYGYFTDPAQHLNLEALQHYGVQKARRPTGGGIIFHLSDLAFSVLIPACHPCFSLNTWDNYAFINQKVAKAVAYFTSQSLQPQLLNQEPLGLNQEYHAFCMAKPTQYDLMIHEKKVGGAAQRRTKQGFLHQASLSLLPPPIDLLQKVLKKGELILEAMHQHSHYLLSHLILKPDLQTARNQLKEILKIFLLDNSKDE
jgi:lipoate-protein ligase A